MLGTAAAGRRSAAVIRWRRCVGVSPGRREAAADKVGCRRGRRGAAIAFGRALAFAFADFAFAVAPLWGVAVDAFAAFADAFPFALAFALPF